VGAAPIDPCPDALFRAIRGTLLFLVALAVAFAGGDRATAAAGAVPSGPCRRAPQIRGAFQRPLPQLPTIDQHKAMA
jgi:hypothetical protein